MSPGRTTAGPIRRASLGARLSAWLAVQGLLTALLVSAVVYGAMAWNLQRRQDDSVEQKREAIRNALAETAGTADRAALAQTLSHALVGHHDIALRLTTAQGEVIFEAVETLAARRAGHAFKRVRWDMEWPTRPPVALQVELALDLADDERLLRLLAATLLLTSLAGAVVASVTGYLLVRRGLLPVRRLSTQVASIAIDRPGLRLDGAGQPPELRPLVAGFNDLLARVERAYAQLEGFNADVAHELRTPLTTLIGASELALRRERPASELRDVIGGNLEDLRRLAAIVNDMLFLSHADRGEQARRTPVASLSAELADLFEYHEASLNDRGLSARVEGDADGRFDVALLRRAVSNLVANATAYATAGTPVTLRIEAHGARVRLAVVNTGPPISEDHLPRLFDRFYRAESSRRRRNGSGDGHHGLGLAIVAGIARMHGGEPFAASNGGLNTIGIDIAADGAPAVGAMPPGHESPSELSKP